MSPMHSAQNVTNVLCTEYQQCSLHKMLTMFSAWNVNNALYTEWHQYFLFGMSTMLSAQNVNNDLTRWAVEERPSQHSVFGRIGLKSGYASSRCISKSCCETSQNHLGWTCAKTRSISFQHQPEPTGGLFFHFCVFGSTILSMGCQTRRFGFQSKICTGVAAELFEALETVRCPAWPRSCLFGPRHMGTWSISYHTTFVLAWEWR